MAHKTGDECCLKSAVGIQVEAFAGRREVELIFRRRIWAIHQVGTGGPSVCGSGGVVTNGEDMIRRGVVMAEDWEEANEDCEKPSDKTRNKMEQVVRSSISVGIYTS